MMAIRVQGGVSSTSPEFSIENVMKMWDFALDFLDFCTKIHPTIENVMKMWDFALDFLDFCTKIHELRGARMRRRAALTVR